MGVMTLCLITLPMFAHQVQTSSECRMIKAPDLFDLQAPRFDAYPVIREKVANPRLDLTSNQVARKYRTVLRLGITEGPNFAGHYRLIHWGCGTSCAMFAVVNLKTGRVITPEGFWGVGGVNLYADEFLPNTESDGWGFRHKGGSKLLIVAGTLLSDNDSKEGAFYFVLNDEKLQLMHSTLVRKNCGGAKD
jgi:hypothetical protein